MAKLIKSMELEEDLSAAKIQKLIKDENAEFQENL